MLTLGAVPGLDMFHFYFIFLCIKLLFAYLLFRAIAAISHPLLLLFLLCLPSQNFYIALLDTHVTSSGLQQAWPLYLEVFLQCRSWSTELVCLAVALLCLAPRNIEKSSWGLGGALLFLGLAAADNPYHLVHITGFALGTLLYFSESNLDRLKSRKLRPEQIYGLVALVVAMLALLGPVFFAVNTDEKSPDVTWFFWLGEFQNYRVLSFYLLPFVLIRRLPREWYPLFGVGIMSGLVTLILPLLFSHRTLADPWRYIRPTLPVLLMLDCGLIAFHVKRLVATYSRSQIQIILFETGAGLLVGLSLATAALTWQSRMQHMRSYLMTHIIFYENAIKVFDRFASTQPDAPTTYLASEENFMITSLVTLSATKGRGLPMPNIGAGLRGSWTQELVDCATPDPVVVVGGSLHLDESGSPVPPCPRCQPEQLTVGDNTAIGGSNFEYYSPTLGWNSKTEGLTNVNNAGYKTPVYPFVVWHCPAKTPEQ